MSAIFKIIFSIVCFFVLSSCGKNAFEEFSQTKDSYDAILEEARLAIDETDYTSAILALQRLDSSHRNKLDVVMLYTSAYAGMCGISFMKIADALTNASGGSVLELAMTTAEGLGTTSLSSCEQAKAEIDRLDPAVALANKKVSLSSFIIGFTRMGIIAKQMDANVDGTIDDRTLICDRDDFTDDDVKKLLTSFTMVVQNVSAFGASSIPGFDFSALLASIQAACPNGATCLTVDEDDLTFDSSSATPVTKATAYVMRSLFATAEIGTNKTDCEFSTLASDCCPIVP